MTYTVRPISDRTAFAGRHRHSPFQSSWTSTEQLLLRELGALRARNTVLEVDVLESGIRIDGRMKANARVSTPSVRVAFDSEHGPLTYATDRFWTWQDNARAIALGLEALRKVDRYGITERGEQYTGFKALGGGTPLPAAPATMSRHEAQNVLSHWSGMDWFDGAAADIFKRARTKAHPDHNGGDHAGAYAVDEAGRVLGVVR